MMSRKEVEFKHTLLHAPTFQLSTAMIFHSISISAFDAACKINVCGMETERADCSPGQVVCCWFLKSCQRFMDTSN